MTYEIIAYLDDNRPWTKEEIKANELTCINYAFANIFGLEIKRPLKKINLINELKAEYPHLKSCISIGGWSADGFSDGVLTAANREILAQNMVDYMQHYSFNGIDLDWEYPGMDEAGIIARPDQDAANFLAFLKVLRQKLDDLGQEKGRHYLLTAAVGAAKKLLDTMSPNDDFEYAQYLDFINVMTYDMRGYLAKKGSHHTNLFPYDSEDQLSVQQAVDYLVDEKGIPARKIVIGSAFYSRNWYQFAPEIENPIGAPAEPNQTTDYNTIRQLEQETPQYFKWDEKAQAPYYFDGGIQMSYDNQRSMSAKAEYVKKRGLLGLMFWEYSLDLSGELLDAAYDVLHA